MTFFKTFNVSSSAAHQRCVWNIYNVANYVFAATPSG